MRGKSNPLNKYNIVGIDPGLRGALCKVTIKGKQILSVDYDTFPTWKRKVGHASRSEYSISEMLSLFDGYVGQGRTDSVYLEHVWGLPKDTPMTAFKFGKGLGIIETCLHASGWADKYALVPPQTWEGIMHLGITKKLTPKRRSEYKVYEIFPQLLEETKHDGVIDAFLIALYGYFKETGVVIR